MAGAKPGKLAGCFNALIAVVAAVAILAALGFFMGMA